MDDKRVWVVFVREYDGRLVPVDVVDNEREARYRMEVANATDAGLDLSVIPYVPEG